MADSSTTAVLITSATTLLCCVLSTFAATFKKHASEPEQAPAPKRKHRPKPVDPDKAEIERLRAELQEHGLDPDP